MKYRPSGVQLPQHSFAGSLHPESNWRTLLPSEEASHSDVD